MAMLPEDLQATFCATLVDEWVRAGVRHAVVAPGSRSTPLALALAAAPGLTVHVHHDERSAAFLALGLALTTGEPTVVLTTSGTGAVELHPAVVEADLAGVPLLVCTADRPPELVDVAAPQAIDQTHLFGGAVRWFHAPGVADPAAAVRWRPLAARAYAEATGPRPGPVHLDLAFREPLVGTAGELPPARGPEGASWAWRPEVADAVEPAIGLAELAGRRGLLLAGPGSGDGAALAIVAEALGWPVIAAPQAPVWCQPDAVVHGADALLRVAPLAAGLRPELVVHLGLPLASRVVGEWAAASGASHLVVAGPGRWVDPHGVAAVVLDADPDAVVTSWAADAEHVTPVDDGAWRDRWREVSRAARAAIDEVLRSCDEPNEPGTAEVVARTLPAGAHLVASSSMPVRDLEWYARPPAHDVTVHANRGANGIDGVVSTAVGVAIGSGVPTALLIGDVAFLHDSNGLLGAARRGIDLVVVVVDNDGGGIFSFLPQADIVAPATFEQLYGTPHGLDLVALAAAYGVDARVTVDVEADLRSALSAGGVHVLVVRTDRAANRALHARLNDAVAATVG